MNELIPGRFYFDPMKVGANRFTRICRALEVRELEVKVQYIGEEKPRNLLKTATEKFEPHSKENLENDRNYLKSLLEELDIALKTTKQFN